jgi:hypothetical protein
VRNNRRERCLPTPTAQAIPALPIAASRSLTHAFNARAFHATHCCWFTTAVFDLIPNLPGSKPLLYANVR